MKFKVRGLVQMMVGVICASGLFADGQTIKEKPFLFETDFSSGNAMEAWFPTEAAMWALIDTKSDQGVALHLKGKSESYRPPFRSPYSMTLLRDTVWGDFSFTAKMKTLQTSKGHRDMCIFWGYQDPANFYYVHLGEKKDRNSSQIFIVDDNPRTPITKKNGSGIPWQNDTWHEVKLIRSAEKGTVEVYFDNMVTPVMTAEDQTFQWGLVGIGSFDDFGLWDDVKINGIALEGRTVRLPNPNRRGKTINKPRKKGSRATKK